MFGSGPVDDLGRLRRRQADEGRLPLQQHRSERAPLHGLGRGRLHAHLRHGRADGLLRRHRGRRRLRAVGLEHGRDAPDPVDAGHRPPPQRTARARSRCCRPSSTAASTSPTSRIVFTPQTDLAILNYIANHIIQTGRGEPGLRRQAHAASSAATTDIGYGLRPEHPLREGGEERQGRRRLRADMTFDEFAKFVADYTLEKAAELSGVPREPARGAGRALRRSRRSRSCRSGPWASTSTRAASGPTTWSTTCTC